MALLAISDLHVTDAEDPLYRSLLLLIGEVAREGDALVLSGDIFDLFVGNQPWFAERYRAFFEAVRAACSRGVQVHYVEGNHDFLMASAFRGMPAGFRLHGKEVELGIDGRRFYVAHGDLVDRSDHGYLALRAAFRSPPFRALFRATPGQWLDAIGRASSRYSRARRPTLPQHLPTERIERLRRTYRSFAAERMKEGFDFVVLGHCHDRDELGFDIAGRRCHYANMGYPRAHGSYLRWEPGEATLSRVGLP